MARVFISHATQDVAIAARIRDWLDVDHTTFLEVNPEDGIEVGEAWRKRLYDELRKADAVVCVVSSASIASSWCTAEVGIADSLGCRLLPVQVEEGVIHPLMQPINHTPLATAREQLGRALRQFDAGGRKLAEDQDPFPGLDPFPTTLSAVFFGRDQETRVLARKLRRAPADGLLTVIGPSGCGKSSLVRAGLLAQLQNDPRWLVLPPWLPGNDPLDALAHSVVKASKRAGISTTRTEVKDRLLRHGLRDIAAELVDDERKLLITIDQAEELFTRADEEHRSVVAQLLRDALGDEVRVIATIRSEFLDDLRALPELDRVHFGSYVLAPLARESLSLVITGPTRVAGLKVADELVAQLVKDTENGEALPLLAFTLQQLAMGLSRGDTLSSELYEILGGVHGALATHADEVLDRAVTETLMTREELLALLASLATLDHAGRPTRKRVNLARLDDQSRQALEVFVKHRLLTASGDKQGRWIGVAHEALFTAWKPLESAIDERLIGLRADQSVELDASQWIEGGSADHLLLNADSFAAIEPLVTPDHLSPDARRFLNASRNRIAAVRRQQRRARRNTVSWLAALLVAAITAATVAAVQWSTASAERDVATATALVAQAQVARNSSPELALRLGLAAHRIAPSSDTRTELANTLLTTRYGGSFGETVSAVAFGPSGHTLVVGSTDGTASLWNLNAEPRSTATESGTGMAVTSVALARDIAAIGSADGSVLLWDTANTTRRERLPSAAPVTSVAFDRDASLLAVGRGDGTTTLWRLGSRTVQLGNPFQVQGSGVSSVAFFGNKLATGSHDGTAVLWDISDPAHPVPGPPLTDNVRKAVNSVAFNHDGTQLATGGSDGVTTLWQLGAQPTFTRLPGHTGAVSSVAFSPTAPTLAAGSHDATALLWDVSDPALPRQVGQPLVGQRSAVSSLSFSPDGTRLVTGSAGGPATVWELADRPRRIGLPLTGHGMLVKSVAFDGDTLVTTGSDNRQIRWDVDHPYQPRKISESTREPGLYPLAAHGTIKATPSDNNTLVLWDGSRRIGKPLSGHRNGVSAAAFSFDGKILAAGSTDGTTILWNITDPDDPEPIGLPLSQNKQITALAFAPDSTKLVAGTYTGAAIVWDVTDPGQPRQLGRPLEGHRMAVNSAAFSRDGAVLATGSSDGTAILWDMTLLDNNIAARACAIAGGGLTEAEWRQHLPGLSYRDTCEESR